MWPQIPAAGITKSEGDFDHNVRSTDVIHQVLCSISILFSVTESTGMRDLVYVKSRNFRRVSTTRFDQVSNARRGVVAERFTSIHHAIQCTNLVSHIVSPAEVNDHIGSQQSLWQQIVISSFTFGLAPK
jgi:hypothetical protein